MVTAGPALKICGIVRQTDLDYCVRSGVAYVGFNFYRGSKRYIQPDDACRLWANRAAVSSTKSVGVVVNPSRNELVRIVRHFPGLEVMQFHGDEPDDLIFWFRRFYPAVQIWRAAPVATEADIERALSLWQRVPFDLLLFDAASGGGDFGGTGRQFNWQLLRSFKMPPHFGIAGGIRPDLIPALMKVSLISGCSVLDIASGVETSPGIKDQNAIAGVIAGIEKGSN